MKKARITLTYAAMVEDEVAADYIHNRLEDYFVERVNMDICDYEGKNSWLVPFQMVKRKTSVNCQSFITMEKMK